MVNSINDEGILKNSFTVTSEGLMYIGNSDTGITLNGTTESISSGNYNTNNGWHIDSNEAIFNNIVARGSIKSSVLEYSNI